MTRSSLPDKDSWGHLQRAHTRAGTDRHTHRQTHAQTETHTHILTLTHREREHEIGYKIQCMRSYKCEVWFWCVID